MSGMYYNNPYANPWAAQNIQQMPMQYGVDETPSAALNGFSGLLGMINPVLGAGVGLAGNLISQSMQNRKQEEFYNKYMSPAARMAQMRAAGINPNAAAQGISGASAPQMAAASPTGAFNSIGEQLGQSANTALTAQVLQAQRRNIDADTRQMNIETLFNEETYEDRVETVAVELGWKKGQKQVMSAFGKYAEEIYHWNAEKAQQDFKNAQKQWQLYESEISKNEAQEDLYDAQTGQYKAATAKLWKEVEFQKWFNGYCVENNMEPGNPYTEYVRHKLIADNAPEGSQEKADAEAWIKAYESGQEAISESQSTGATVGQVDNTPEGQVKQQYVNMMNDELARLDAEVQEIRNRGGNVDMVAYNKRKKAILREYRNKIRRLNKGVSAGVKVAGTGVDFGS